MDADGQCGLQVVGGQLHNGVGDSHGADGDVPLTNAQAFVQHGMCAHD